MNQDHPAYRAAQRIDPIAAEFWQDHRLPSAGTRLVQLAEIIDLEYRTVDATPAKPSVEDATARLIYDIEMDQPMSVIRAQVRELKEALRK